MKQSPTCCCCKVASVVSDSVQPHRRQPNRLPHPWDSPGKNTGVGCHFLLQCTRVKSESEVVQSCPTQRPHGLQPTRLLCPWDFPGKSTGVGCHYVVRCMKVEINEWSTSVYSCLENLMDRRAWLAQVHGVAQSGTQLKRMATHSSVLAWRIPGMRKPGGRPSMGPHRVGHDWSDLTAAAAAFEKLVLFYLSFDLTNLLLLLFKW